VNRFTKIAIEIPRNNLYYFLGLADQVGYKDYFYFSKMFKKTMGVPPRGYRYDQNQNNSIPAPF
jgi:YesN/AraC family two-component response regulator